ncbi:hypothetical protein BH11GEM1_BH11GEM1_30430 [soil metagenome]
MAVRTFEDSSGVIWEVFEVHRTSEAPRGVSAGLEKGWLSFVSDTGKRRLAPFPTVWREATDMELEQLCAQARLARPPRFNEQPTSAIAGRSFAKPYAGTRVAPSVPSIEGPPPDAVEGEAVVRAIVRAFARDARLNKLPAIEAMVRLKGLLHEQHGGSDAAPALRAVATDVARVRRWFVEAFYFDRPM